MPLTAASPQLYFEDRGVGESLLAITGFAASSTVLDAMADRYATRLRVITYDHPGTGRSSKRTFAGSMAGFAAGAVRVLDELEIEAATVAGISFGGAVAIDLALRHPDRVRRLVLMATTASSLGNKPDAPALAAMTARILDGSVRRRRLWLGPSLFSPEFLAREPDRADALLRTLGEHPASPLGLVGQLCAAGMHARTSDLGAIRAPTLVLHGERDPLVGVANARRLAERIPDAELQVLAGGRHGFMVEQADETFAIVADWLARRGP
jgi:pimeloyl-ACP methyl ester carboxylesterase